MSATTTNQRAAPPYRPGLSADDPWLLRRIVESMTSGLVVLDEADRVVIFNAAAETITGFGRDEVVGKLFHDCLGAANRRVLLSELGRATPPRENREVTLTSRTGARMPLGYSSSPLVDENGAVVGTVIIFKDLTEISELRREMQRREHFATVGEMTALIAHEIRNPLAAMHTAAETLKGELGYDEEKEEYLTIIIREIKRVNSLVSDFFTYVKPVEVAAEPVDVHELLDVLVFIEGGKMRKAGIKVVCAYAADVPPVLADRNLLQQALLNILLNAFQATSVGGTVTIATSYAEPDDDASGELDSPAGELCISIDDTGEGIPDDQLARVFKPFYTTKTKGIGLGLAITDRLVKAMSGRIEVVSKRGRGTRFTIHLPVTPA